MATLAALAIIVIGVIAVSIPFLYYWIKSLRVATVKKDRSRFSSDLEGGDINISLGSLQGIFGEKGSLFDSCNKDVGS
jgi:hypothetical protein